MMQCRKRVLIMESNMDDFVQWWKGWKEICSTVCYKRVTWRLTDVAGTISGCTVSIWKLFEIIQQGPIFEKLQMAQTLLVWSKYDYSTRQPELRVKVERSRVCAILSSNTNYWMYSVLSVYNSYRGSLALFQEHWGHVYYFSLEESQFSCRENEPKELLPMQLYWVSIVFWYTDKLDVTSN